MYGLYKKEDKKLSDTIVNKLTKLTIKYKGNIDYINKKLKDYIRKYQKYENFINNYFINEKFKFFGDNSLNYDLVPVNFKTNNFLKNSHILSQI